MRYKKANDIFENLPEWIKWLFRISILAIIIANFLIKKG
jgi:hypothetical protein